MRKKCYIPFLELTQEGWINLALAATLTFYIILIGFSLINNHLCGNLAFDFCAYWAGGKVANEHGIAQVYDLKILQEVQTSNYPQEIISQAIDSSTSLVAVPLPYLPIFILPFQLLSLIDLPYSYFFWALINIIGFILYLRFFAKKAAGHVPSFRILLMIGLSLPVFLNFREGQLNVWLGICAGEFIRAFISDKPLKAGLWLGGWLLKPQLLILIIPFLLIQRHIKALSGFIISTVSLLAVSFILIGVNGFLKLKDILLDSAGGGAVSNPWVMMNWRMLGLYIDTFTSSNLGWVVIIIGTLLTVGLFIKFMKISVDPTSDKFVIALLGIFAATCAVTWHAHIHTSMILIPTMLLLLMRNRFNQKIFLTWVFMPILVYFLGYTSLALVAVDIPLTHIRHSINFAYGLSGLGLNLFLLGWSINEYTRIEK